MRAVVQPLNFAELQRIQDHAHVPIAGEPRTVMLVGDFVAIADTVRNHRPVTAEI